MSMKHIIITIIALLAVTACSQETVKIGYIGPITGPSAVLGMDTVEAIEIALEGTNIQLIAEDDQYNPAKTVQAYNKLVHADQVEIILMSSYGGVLALADQAVEDGVIIIDPLDCNSQLAESSENVFCVATETESIATVLAKQATGKVGVLYTTVDPFMTLVKETITSHYKGEMQTSSYEPGENDFRSMLLKMEDVDSLVLLGYDETGLAMRQARELGMDANFYATGTATSPSLQKAAQGTAEGTIIAFWEASTDNLQAQAFELAFQERVGRPPILDLTAHPAYDATKIAIVALQQHNVEAMRQSILATSNYDGTTGTITVESDGGARIEESAFRIEGGIPVRMSRTSS